MRFHYTFNPKSEIFRDINMHPVHNNGRETYSCAFKEISAQGLDFNINKKYICSLNKHDQQNNNLPKYFLWAIYENIKLSCKRILVLWLDYTGLSGLIPKPERGISL